MAKLSADVAIVGAGNAALCAALAAAENGGGFFGIEEAATVVTVLGR